MNNSNRISSSADNVSSSSMKNLDSAGTAWVEDAIQRICRDEKLPSITASWLPESNDLFVALSIVSKDGKRVSKLFSQYELASCAKDSEIQAQLLDRIAHLLRFLYPERRKQKQS
ncbi:MAG: hypothetical protein WCT03_27550 [Candidatus Obscuribacterales bacterium]